MSRPATTTRSATKPAAPAPETRLRLLLIALALVLASLAVYAPGLGNDFADWDDSQNVLDNPFLNPVTGQGLARLWTAPYYGLYTPLTYTVWALCAVLARSDTPLARPSGGTTTLDASVFHAVSLLLHIGCALLAFGLLRRLLRHLRSGEDAAGAPPADRARDLAAGAGAALFALHPLQVESVAWVTGMNNVLSALFALLALSAYLTGSESGRLSPKVGATALFALALLAKPTVAALPLAALLIDAAVLRRPWRRSLPVLLVWAALSAAMAVVTRSTSGGSRPPDLPLWGRPFLVGDSLAFYLGKLLLPQGLCPDYGRRPEVVLGNAWVYAAWVVPAAVALAAWRWRWRGVLVGLGLFAALTLPVLGVVPFYFQTYSMVADRYVYLAMIGPALALASILERGLLNPRRPVHVAAAACAAVAVAAWAALSLRQVRLWRDTPTLWGHTLAVNPRSAAAYNNLGVSLNRQGRADEALAAFEKAAEIGPVQTSYLYNTAYVLLGQGQIEASKARLRESLGQDPGFVDAHNLLGLALLQEARVPEALAAFEAALGARPGDAVTRDYLAAAHRITEGEKTPADVRAEAASFWGVMLARRGETGAAVAAFDRALRERPGDADAWFQKGLTLGRAGDADGARSALREALRLRPNWTEARQALEMVGDAAAPPP